MRSSLCCFTLLVVILTGCYSGQGPKENKTEPTTNAVSPPVESPAASPAASIEPTPTLAPTPTPTPAPITHRVQLSAIGDILLHNRVYEDAKLPDGTYNFKPMFEKVKDLLEQPDILVANQESMAGGSELGVSSYPMFNSPHEISDALLDVGVDLVTMANNHTMDKKAKGILSATAYLDKIGMPYTGAFRSQEDRDRIRVIMEQGITFAFLAYTYGTNGMIVPEDQTFLVNLLEPELMKSDIEQARKLADVVVVSPHWGIEYATLPNTAQTELAQQMADWGVDIIIGHHPHVLQPFKWLERSEGGRTLVMYSLGNFLSAQNKMLQMLGGIGQVEVVKTVANGTTTIELENPTFIPTFNQYKNYANFRVIPLNRLEAKKRAEVEPHWNQVKNQMLEYLPEIKLID
ncbi:CapA family protein [Paenibacillus eucommiae]|nr:CapA family protein [Paenibacillus eucommiae]